MTQTTAAFLATLTALTLAAFWTPLSVPVVTLGGLIVLIPGLSLTLAMTEIATRHLVSGTARLTGALVLFLTIVRASVARLRIDQALKFYWAVVAVLALANLAWVVIF